MFEHFHSSWPTLFIEKSSSSIVPTWQCVQCGLCMCTSMCVWRDGYKYHCMMSIRLYSILRWRFLFPSGQNGNCKTKQLMSYDDTFSSLFLSLSMNHIGSVNIIYMYDDVISSICMVMAICIGHVCQPCVSAICIFLPLVLFRRPYGHASGHSFYLSMNRTMKEIWQTRLPCLATAQRTRDRLGGPIAQDRIMAK